MNCNVAILSKLGLSNNDLKNLTGDASARRYFSLINDPQKILAVYPIGDPSFDNYIHLSAYFSERGIKTPQIFDYDSDLGYILQENMGDFLFSDILANSNSQNEIKNYYQLAIDEILKYQKISDFDTFQDYQFLQYQFDSEKLSQENEQTSRYFLEQYLLLPPEEVSLIHDFFNQISEYIAQDRSTICHRDYHSRNLFLHHRQMTHIDFQDARLGRIEYDLVSLLEDAYFLLPTSTKNDLKYYFYKKSGAEKTFEQFEFDYAAVALQRLYKAIGSFCFMNFEKSNSRYLKNIGLSFEKMRNIFFDLKIQSESFKLLLKRYYER